MHRFPRSIASRLFIAVLNAILCASGTSLIGILFIQTSLAQSSVRQVKVVGNKGAVEIEVEASDRITPQTQVLTAPDRLVVDFPNSVPGTALRNQSVNVGNVKDVRFGLFQSKPPVTRLVLDLKTAQSFQIFPYGRTVMIKVTGAPEAAVSAGAGNFSVQPATRPGLVNANYSVGSSRIQPNTQPQNALQQNAPSKPVEVSFRNGLLAIKANKATFAEVLSAVKQRTGADIEIPAGADQERIVADIGPGQPQEVIASLLNGSSFNFMILNSASDPRQLDRVILTLRTAGPVTVSSSAPPPQQQASDEDQSYNEPPPQPDARPAAPVAALPQSQPAAFPAPPRPAENDTPVTQ
jgi:hypothetical protein